MKLASTVPLSTHQKGQISINNVKFAEEFIDEIEIYKKLSIDIS